MKYFKIITLLCLCSCQPVTNKVEDKPSIDKLEPFEYQLSLVDTIPERNSPTSLDLSKHQLFIDTTRTSQFYNKITKWRPGEFEKEQVAEYLSKIEKDYKPSKIDIQDFSVIWIFIRQLDSRLILYHKCDGIERRYEITPYSFNTYGPLESEAAVISKLLELSEDKIKIEVKTMFRSSEVETTIISIKKTQTENVFLLTYLFDGEEDYELITPMDKADQFELLVDHCPEDKVSGFDEFDNIDFEKYN